MVTAAGYGSASAVRGFVKRTGTSGRAKPPSYERFRVSNVFPTYSVIRRRGLGYAGGFMNGVANLGVVLVVQAETSNIATFGRRDR